MYSTVGDLGTWAGTGFGSTLLSEKLGAARVGGPTTKSDGDVIVLMVKETGSLPDALPTLLGVADPELRQTLAAER
jgi:D-alanyl-D-alanine carboxypeptidase